MSAGAKKKHLKKTHPNNNLLKEKSDAIHWILFAKWHIWKCYIVLFIEWESFTAALRQQIEN